MPARRARSPSSSFRPRPSCAFATPPRIGDGRALVRGRRAACTTLIGGMAHPRIFALVNDVGSGPPSDGDFGCAWVGRVGPTYGGVRGKRRWFWQRGRWGRSPDRRGGGGQ